MSDFPAGTAEQMALAVLRGDLVAARQLADALLNDWEGGAVHLPPLKGRLPADAARLRVVVYASAGVQIPPGMDFRRQVDQEVLDWLRGGAALALSGVDRLELYELPEGFKIAPAQPPPRRLVNPGPLTDVEIDPISFLKP